MQPTWIFQIKFIDQFKHHKIGCKYSRTLCFKCIKKCFYLDIIQVTHPLRGVLDVGPGVQVGGELVQPVVDVEAALRGGGGRGHGHRAAGRGGGRGGRGGGAGSAALEDSCLGCLGASTSGICWIRLTGSLAGFLAGSLASASVAGEVCSVSASWPKLGSVGRKLEVET